jgi:tetratricopeptide (TPR) repeat protein
MVAQNVGVAYREAGRLDLADRYLQQGLDLYREAGAAIQQAEVLNELGKLCLDTDDLDSGVVYLDEALAIAGRQGDWLCEADIRTTLGQTRHRQGRLPEAHREWRLALTLHEQHHSHRGAAVRSLLDET